MLLISALGFSLAHAACPHKPNTATTFAVADVEWNQTAVLKNPGLKEAIVTNRAYRKYNILAASDTPFVNYDLDPEEFEDRDFGINALLKAAHLAFANHYGLTLSPEVVYVAILQSLATHVKQNPDLHREALGISNKEKEKIHIILDDYPGNNQENWQALFNLFRDEIAKRIPTAMSALLTRKFTTSTPLSTTVNALAVMDIYQSYFKYSGGTRCGIPEVTLEGTPQDWAQLRDTAKGLLGKLDGTKEWAASLIPVLDQFVRAANNQVDVGFWTSLYKVNGGSGGPFVNGWINAFFPYVGFGGHMVANTCLDWEHCKRGTSVFLFTAGTSVTPFTWETHEAPGEKLFLSGIVGIEADNTKNHLKPTLGWAVLEEKQ